MGNAQLAADILNVAQKNQLSPQDKFKGDYMRKLRDLWNARENKGKFEKQWLSHKQAISTRMPSLDDLYEANTIQAGIKEAEDHIHYLESSIVNAVPEFYSDMIVDLRHSTWRGPASAMVRPKTKEVFYEN